MSFVEFERTRTSGADRRTVKAFLIRPKNADTANLTITLSQRLVSDLKWDTGAPVKIMMGIEDDQGVLRLRSDKSATITLTERRSPPQRNGERSTYFSLAMGHVKQFVNRQELSRSCTFEMLKDGWLQVVLPPWATEKPGPVSDGSVAAILKTAPALKPDWLLLPSEEDLVRYLLASIECAAKKQALLDVARRSDPDMKTDGLAKVLGRIRRKLDASGCTLQEQAGGMVRLVGKVNQLVAAD